MELFPFRTCVPAGLPSEKRAGLPSEKRCICAAALHRARDGFTNPSATLRVSRWRISVRSVRSTLLPSMWRSWILLSQAKTIMRKKARATMRDAWRFSAMLWLVIGVKAWRLCAESRFR